MRRSNNILPALRARESGPVMTKPKALVRAERIANAILVIRGFPEDFM